MFSCRFGCVSESGARLAIDPSEHYPQFLFNTCSGLIVAPDIFGKLTALQRAFIAGDASQADTPHTEGPSEHNKAGFP